MANYTWLVFTNCAEGQDEAFNRWYDHVHLPDLLRIPGIVGVHRSRLTNAQMLMSEAGPRHATADEIGARYRYLAVYRIESADVQAVLEEVKRRAGTPDMMLTEWMTEAHTVLHEDI